MTQIKAVIFDMDGTLLDTERIYRAAWLDAGRQLGLAHAEEVLHACTGRNGADTRAYFHQVYGDSADYDTFHRLRNARYEQTVQSEGILLKPGAMETLQWLKKQGIQMALATMTIRPRVLDHLSRTGLTDFFQAVVTGDMVRCGKPNPDIFLLAASLLHVDPTDCMGVEDSINGVRALHAAGMYTVMVPDLQAPDPHDRLPFDQRCDTLASIPALIQSINERK